MGAIALDDSAGILRPGPYLDEALSHSIHLHLGVSYLDIGSVRPQQAGSAAVSIMKYQQ